MSSVINLNNYKQEAEKKENIWYSLELIMEEYKDRSVNTYKTYLRNFKEFFDIVVEKEIKNVLWGDLERIEYVDILEYRKTLKNKGNSNKTINLKTASISTMFKELSKLNKNIDSNIVNIKKLPEDPIEENSYGSLTESEVEGLIEYCKELPEHRKPLEKALFFKLSYITAIRQGAMLKMKWDNIEEVVNENGNTLWVIRIRDKGKHTETAITDNVYKELLEIKVEGEDRVFPTTRKTLSKVLHEYCDVVGIDHKERNIVLHSLKKASIDKVYRETGDITQTARHGKHSNIEMVYQVYEGRNANLFDSPSVTVFDEESQKKIQEELKKYSKTQLIKAIMYEGGGVGRNILKTLERGEYK